MRESTSVGEMRNSILTAYKQAYRQFQKDGNYTKAIEAMKAAEEKVRTEVGDDFILVKGEVLNALRPEGNTDPEIRDLLQSKAFRDWQPLKEPSSNEASRKRK